MTKMNRGLTFSQTPHVMFTWVTALIIVLAVVGLVTWRIRALSRTHARFQSKDVEEALAEVLSPDALTHDTFDLFLAWPIDDPGLSRYASNVWESSWTVVLHRQGKI